MKLASTVLTILALAMTVGAQTANQTKHEHVTLEGNFDPCGVVVCATSDYIRKDSNSHHYMVSVNGGPEIDVDEITNPPKPEWVPDPSAGHYDCPDGWTAMASVEPMKYYDRFQLTPTVYVSPTLDKKGHELKSQPAPPICIKDKP